MDSFWNHIDEHRKSYLALYYQALALYVREQKEKEADNLKPVVKIKISNRVTRYCHQGVVAEDPRYQHGREPAKHERGFSPDDHPE